MDYEPINVTQDKIARSNVEIERLEAENPALARVNSECLNQPRGYQVTKARLLELIADTDERNIAKTIKHWRVCVLAKHGIYAEYSAKIRGYVFPTAEHELHKGYDKRTAAVQRKLKREALRLSLIEDGDLSDHDKLRRLRLVDGVNETVGKIEAQRTRAGLWNKRPETIPRIGVS